MRIIILYVHNNIYDNTNNKTKHYWMYKWKINSQVAFDFTSFSNSSLLTDQIIFGTMLCIACCVVFLLSVNRKIETIITESSALTNLMRLS